MLINLLSDGRTISTTNYKVRGRFPDGRQKGTAMTESYFIFGFCYGGTLASFILFATHSYPSEQVIDHIRRQYEDKKNG
jgi:hypothetical protein